MSRSRSVRLALFATVSTFGLASAAAAGTDWTMYGGNYANWSYSELDAIDRDNVAGLDLAWAHSIGTLLSQESRPIVVDGRLYVTSSLGPRYVWALDAASGEILWKAEVEMPQGVQQYACCGQVNRVARPSPTASSMSAGSTASSRRSMRQAARNCGRRMSSTTGRARSSPRRRWW